MKIENLIEIAARLSDAQELLKRGRFEVALELIDETKRELFFRAHDEEGGGLSFPDWCKAKGLFVNFDKPEEVGQKGDDAQKYPELIAQWIRAYELEKEENERLRALVSDAAERIRENERLRAGLEHIKDIALSPEPLTGDETRPLWQQLAARQIEIARAVDAAKNPPLNTQ